MSAMLHSNTVTFDSSVTLNAADYNCYLESQGSGESPTARLEGNTPLLSFERSVFRFARTESSIVDRVARSTMVYGSTIRIVNPATMLVVCVVRTESASQGKGYRVEMRPPDSAPLSACTFRIGSNMRNRSGTHHVVNRDRIVLQLENSELYIGAVESRKGDSIEIIAGLEPKNWSITMFDEGYSASTGFAFASRVLAIEHRFHRSFLTHGPPLRPSEHRRAAQRRSLWVAEDNEGGGSDSGGGGGSSASTVSGARSGEDDSVTSSLTTDVYFQDHRSSENEHAHLSMKFSCSCTGLWIAENLDPTMGGPLRVNHKYRFRHMSTGRYLAIVETAPGRFEPTTLYESDEAMLSRSIFLLDSNAEDERGHISSYHSFVRLQHVQTGLWLGSQPHLEFRVASTEAIRRPNMHDRISLRHPSDTIVSKMLLLMNYMKYIREYISAFHKISTMPLSVQRVTSDVDLRYTTDHACGALQSLLQFCSSSSEAHRNAFESFIAGGGVVGDLGGSGGTSSSSSSVSADGNTEGGVDDISESMPNKEHQHMLIELMIPQLVLTLLIAPYSATLDLKKAIPLRGGVVTIEDLHDRSCGHLLRVHNAALALLQRICKTSTLGSNVSAEYCDVLLHMERSGLRAGTTLHTILESCTSLTETQEVTLAKQLMELLRSEGTRLASASMYLKCLGCLKKATESVRELVRCHEKEILFTMSTSMGRMTIVPPRPETVGFTNDSYGGMDETSFELFVSHGDPDRMEGLITSMQLLIALVPSEHRSEGFQYIASRISREHIVHVLKATFGRDNSNRGDNPLFTIQSLMVNAAMKLYLFPSLEDQFMPVAPIIYKESPTTHSNSDSDEGQHHQQKHQLNDTQRSLTRSQAGGTITPPHMYSKGVSVTGSPTSATPPPALMEAAGRASEQQQYQQQREDKQPMRAGVSVSMGDASFVRQVKASTLDMLKSSPFQIVQQKGKNLLLTSCVRVWGLVLEHGLATQKEVEEVLPLLLSLMDGRSDQYSAHVAHASWNRYENNDSSAIVISTKISVCEVIRSHLQSLIQTSMTSIATSVANRVKASDICSEVVKRAETCRRLLAFPSSIITVLLDLVRYHSDKLVSCSLILLTELSHMFKNLARQAHQLIILPSPLRYTCSVMMQHVAVLHKKVHSCSSDDFDVELDLIHKLVTLVWDRQGFKNHRPVVGDRPLAIQGEDHGESEEDAWQSPYDEEEAEALRRAAAHQAVDHHEILLRVLGSLSLPALLLPVIPSHNCDLLGSMLEFFDLFCALPSNARLLSADWPIFFEVLLREDSISRRHIVLRILEKVLPHGNQVSPVSRNDIRELIRLFMREKYPGCIQVLRSMFIGSVALPWQQRDIASLLMEAGALGDGWWLKVPPETLRDLLDLMVLCSEGNAYVQVHFQNVFSADSVLFHLQSLHVEHTSLKALLIKFLTVIHLQPTGTSTRSSGSSGSNALSLQASTANQMWTLNEVWWRVVRDDFSMRFDELATLARVHRRGGGMRLSNEGGASRGSRGEDEDHLSGGQEWRRYAFECSLALRAFFAHRFVLQSAVRVDWVSKEIRSTVSSVTQLLYMTSQLDLSVAEMDALVMLGRSMAEALSAFNDPTTPRLRSAIDEAKRHRASLAKGASNRAATATEGDGEQQQQQHGDSPHVNDGGANYEPRRQSADAGMRIILREILKRLVEHASTDYMRCATIVESYVTPSHIHGLRDPRRLIVEKMLRLCGQLALEPTATRFLLMVMERCISKVSDDHSTEMQIVFGACGAMQVATILLDAADKSVSLQALRVGIAAMRGGNLVNQDTFLKYFMSNDERFFASAKRTLETGALEVSHYRKSLLLKSQADIGGSEEDELFMQSASSKEGASITSSYHCCQPLLRFIQLLCEGHHYALQEYCREQRDNIRSVNAVQFCVSFLDSITEGGHEASSEGLEPMVLQCFANLTEFCQGPCSANQSMIISSGLLCIAGTLLRNRHVSAACKRAVMTTLISLVEGSTDPHVAETIISQLPLDIFEPFFENIVTAAATPSSNNNNVSDSASSSKDEELVAFTFDVGIFLRTLSDLLSSGVAGAGQLLSKQAVPYLRIQKILQRRPDVDAQTGRIQIEREGQLELVYFRIPQSCRRIREDSKDKLLWEVDRSSQSAKHSSFYDLTEGLILELDLVAALEAQTQHWTEAIPVMWLREAVSSIARASQRRWIVTSVALALCSNALLLLEMSAMWLHVPVGVAQCVVCAVVMYWEWTIAGAVYYHKRLRKNQRRLGIPDSISSTRHQSQMNRSSFTRKAWDWIARRIATVNSPQDTVMIDSKNTSVNDESMDKDSVPSQSSQLSLHEATTNNLAYEAALIKASRPSFVAVVFMLLTAIVGLGRPEFYSLHLFWCISLSPSLQNVISAVTLNRRTLAVTLFLGMLFCYAFSLFGFTIFPEDFDTDDDPSTSENCSSLWHCFIHVATTGLRQGGGVGEVMKSIPWGSRHFIARRLYDFLYFTIMIVIFLNILFGIIIDTFAELRDAKHDKEQDMRLKCFVCGLSSHVFDQHGDGFVAHTKAEHNMWQYLFFIQHLKLKDRNDYTGQESYVATSLSKKDFSFFPTRSLRLEQKINMNDASQSGNGSVKELATMSRSGGAGGGSGDGGDSSSVMLMIKSLQQEMRVQQEVMKSTVREWLQPSAATSREIMGSTADDVQGRHNTGSRMSQKEMATLSMAPLILTNGNEFRIGENVGTQTAFSSSVVGLESAAQEAKKEAATYAQEAHRVRQEMKLQLEEIRKLQLSQEHFAELQLSQAAAKSEVKDLTRQLDAMSIERDALVRQSAFLQAEVERLVLDNAKLSATTRSLMTRSRVEDSFRGGGSSRGLAGVDLSSHSEVIDGGSTAAAIAQRSGNRSNNDSRPISLTEQLRLRSQRFEELTLDDSMFSSGQ